jgi:uncharacterized damage-inducible protein DinB
MSDDDRRNLMARLAAERAGLLEKLLGLDEHTLTEEPALNGWTVKDMLAHIAAWDRWEERTMRSMVAQEAPDLAAAQDVDAANAAFVAAWRDRSLGEVIAELMAARGDWVTWLQGLPDEELFRPRSYAGYDWTFSAVPLRVQWEHDAEHAKQIADWCAAHDFEKMNGPMMVLLAAVEAAREELLTAAALVPAVERTSRPVCGVWTLKDVLGHIADWERFAVEGLRQMAAGQPPDPQPIGDTETWNQSHAEARRDQPWKTVWDDLHRARQAYLDVLDGMDPPQLGRVFPFPWGPEGTPYQWTCAFAHHDREHAKDVRDAMIA